MTDQPYESRCSRAQPIEKEERTLEQRLKTITDVGIRKNIETYWNTSYQQALAALDQKEGYTPSLLQKVARNYANKQVEKMVQRYEES